MIILLAGVLLFVLTHSIRPLAPQWRLRMIDKLGANAWKGIYSVFSIASFALLVIGFSAARQEPVVLWTPPVWTRHIAALLVLVAFVFAACSLVPGTRISQRMGHPLLLGTKTWAVAHLIANGNLADVILFGGFLIWAVVLFIVSRKRDRAEGVVYPAGNISRDAMAVIVGVGLWAAFAFWLHAMLIGVAPFG